MVLHVPFALSWLRTEFNSVVNAGTFCNHAVLYDRRISKYDSMPIGVIHGNDYLKHSVWDPKSSNNENIVNLQKENSSDTFSVIACVLKISLWLCNKKNMCTSPRLRRMFFSALEFHCHPAIIG